jgi:hypothetical protein
MSKRFRVAIIAAVAILACLGGAAILEIQTKVIRRVFDNLMQKSGKTLVAAALALEYGFTDIDGKQPRVLTAAEA